MTDTDTIRAPVQRPQYPQQPQSVIRPNVNPVPTVVRPPPPPQISGQAPTGTPQQRPAPSPLRRVDSRGNIQTNQFQNQQRPVGPPPVQQVRPPLGHQSPQQQPPLRPQAPSTWAGTVAPQQQQQQSVIQQQQPVIQQQQQQQPSRPPYPYPNQPQNAPTRPPYQRPPPQQQTSVLPNQTQFRPPFPQQPQQRPSVPPSQPLRAMQNQNQIPPQSPKNQSSFERMETIAPEISKTNLMNSSFISNNDDDDDVIIGKASTPLKNAKPIDPMTQSQYGFLDNRTSNAINEDNSKKPQTGHLTSFTDDTNKYKFSNNTEEKSHTDLMSNENGAPKSPMAPSLEKMSSFDRNSLQRNNSRNSIISSSDRYDIMTENKPKEAPTQQPMSPPGDNRNTPAVNRDRPPSYTTEQKPAINLNSIIGNDNVTHAPPPHPKTFSDFNKEAQKKADNWNRNGTDRVDQRNNYISRINKGDNDSGVDESTQGNERNGPGSPGSPLKSPTKIPGVSRPPSTTPSNKSNKSRSASRNRTLKTPEPEPSKKVPMNKIQVGHAPSPNLKAVRSKIGSLDNAAYKPGGGNVKIETKKIDIKATPRIEAKNDRYVPKGGDKKIVSTKLQWNAKSKIGSLENAHHKPGGGDKKIETIKADFKDKAKPKVGSKDNTKHVPKGGDIKIHTHKIEIKAQSKIGSMDNVKHKPGGGDKKIFDDKDYLKNVEHPVALSPPSQSPTPAVMTSSSGADENLNQQQS